MRQRVDINPEMLKWARSRAGLSMENAAKKAGLRDSVSSSAVDKLELLENGTKSPTFHQFLKFAKIYHQSPLVFSLNKPPVISEIGVQLENMNLTITDEERGLLNALIVDIKASQSLLQEIVQDDEDFKPLEFVGSFSADDNILQSVTRISELLNIPFEENWTKKFTTTAKLFEFLREKIENIGAFVMLRGNLGSYHSRISQSVFCGYVIADRIAPFIVINENDSLETQVYTLIHGLVHILTGQTQAITPHNRFEISENANSLEKFCASVAGEFLLPADKINFKGNPNNIGTVKKFIEAAVKDSAISAHLITFRIWQLGLISSQIRNSLLGSYSIQTRETDKRMSGSGEKLNRCLNYYANKRQKLGKATISIVKSAMKSNVLTHTKAAIVLDTKPTSVDQILGI